MSSTQVHLLIAYSVLITLVVVYLYLVSRRSQRVISILIEEAKPDDACVKRIKDRLNIK